MTVSIKYFASSKTDGLCSKIFDNAVQSAERKACISLLDKQICKMNGIDRSTISNREMHRIRVSVFKYYKRSI